MPRARTFDAWMAEVDAALLALTGEITSHLDIADQPWRDWFNDELSPEEAAEEALEEEGFPFETVHVGKENE